MPIPAPISPNDGFHYLLGGFESSNGQFAFEHNGNLYVFGSGVVDSNFAPYNLFAVKSTDGGVTWNQVGGVGPISAVGMVITTIDERLDSFTCVKDGNNVRFVGTEVPFTFGSPPYGITWVVTFNLTTDTWGARTTDSLTIYGQGDAWQLIFRGINDYILVFNGPTVSYATFDGATFGVPVALPVDPGYGALSGIVDSVGNTHFLLWSGLGIGHITLKADGTFGAFQIILDVGLTYYNGPYGSRPSRLKIANISGVETLVFAALGVSVADNTIIPMLYVHAPIAINPVWVTTVAVVGNEVDGDSDLMPDHTQSVLWNPVDIVQQVSGGIQIVWTYTSLVDDLWVGEWWESHTICSNTVWSGHSSLFRTPAPINGNVTGWVANQTIIDNITGGVGVWGGSDNSGGDNNGASVYQTQFIAIPDVAPITLSVVGGTCIQAAGGTGPYTYIVNGGALPLNLTLDPVTGCIVGVSIEAGLFTFRVRATDANGCFAEGIYSITVITPVGECPTITVGIVAGCIQASGGTEPYDYEITGGALPDGLVLNSTTGCITGTPTVTGTFNFTVTATDANGCTEATAFDIAVINPNMATLSICGDLCCICCFELLGIPGRLGAGLGAYVM